MFYSHTLNYSTGSKLPARGTPGPHTTIRAVAAICGALPLAVIRVCHRLYKLFLSPLIGNQCRFFPTCSDYALEAFERHGMAHGSMLAAKRLVRCCPLHEGGLDPVPPPRE